MLLYQPIFDCSLVFVVVVVVVFFFLLSTLLTRNCQRAPKIFILNGWIAFDGGYSLLYNPSK